MNTNQNALAISYPVGAVYISTVQTNPRDLFGGEWRQLKDKFLLAGGDNYPAGLAGGEAQHTLTISELPAHMHVRITENEAEGTQTEQQTVSVSQGSSANYSITATTSTCNQPHNNMPPYIAVYMWERIR